MKKNVDIVSELIGDWGAWQFRTVILIYLCKIPSAWFMACIIFTAPIPKPGEISCYQPESQSVFNQNASLEHRYISQKDLQIDFCIDSKNRTYDQATLNNLSYAEDENIFETLPCSSFQYNTPFETTVTKFNLVCSRSILIATSQFFHLFGVLTGGILATRLMEM